MNIIEDRKKIKIFNEVFLLVKSTRKQLKELKNDTDRNNPVDVDILKTTKAMFYERVLEIFRKYMEEK